MNNHKFGLVCVTLANKVYKYNVFKFNIAAITRVNHKDYN